MNKYRATFVGVVIVAAFAFSYVMQSALADDKYLTLAEAVELGMKVELVTPKPKVVYATLRCSETPQDAQIVIRNEKGDWIANTSMAIKDNACSAWIGEEYVGKSYFLVSSKAGDTYHVPLR